MASLYWSSVANTSPVMIKTFQSLYVCTHTCNKYITISIDNIDYVVYNIYAISNISQRFVPKLRSHGKFHRHHYALYLEKYFSSDDKSLGIGSTKSKRIRWAFARAAQLACSKAAGLNMAIL